MQGRASSFSLRPLGALVAVGVGWSISFAIGAALHTSVLSADAVHYHALLTRIFGGAVPYTGGTFEFLPFALAPMGLAWALGGFAGSDAFVFVFSLLTALAAWSTFLLLGIGGRRLGDPGVGSRWLWLTLPMFPLLVFRLDLWVVLASAAAMTAAVTGHESAHVGLTAVGVWTKGWPALLAVPDWWRGRRRAALLGGPVAVLLLTPLLLTPGFVGGRGFVGIHSETVAGSLLVLTRLIRHGLPGLVESAGAVYVRAPHWLVLLQAAIGVGWLASTAVVVGRRPFEWRRALLASGTLVAALLVASPLLSPQFIVWLTPFVAFSSRRSTLWSGGAVAVLTIASTATWSELARGASWWFGLVTLRNGVLVALGILLYREATRRSDPSPG